MDIKPIDIVAMLTFTMLAVLVVLGHNGEIRALMGLIIGYYFGEASRRIYNNIKGTETVVVTRELSRDRVVGKKV